MIKELFLSCAMALPSPNFHNNSDREMTARDVLVINNMLTMMNRTDSDKSRKKTKRIVMIGGSSHLVSVLKSLRHRVIRLRGPAIHSPSTIHDIIADVIHIPIKRDIAQVVIFYYGTSFDQWHSMARLSESIGMVKRGGFFIFDPIYNSNFSFHLNQLGFTEIPSLWMGLVIFRNEGKRPRGSPSQLISGA